MDKNTKITLAELIKRKEQVLEAKKNVKRARVYVKSLGGEIVIKGIKAPHLLHFTRLGALIFQLALLLSLLAFEDLFLGQIDIRLHLLKIL